MVKLGLKYGFRVLYHCSYADAEALDMLEAKKSEIFVAPAVGLAHGAIHADPSLNLPEALIQRGHKILALQRALVPELMRRSETVAGQSFQPIEVYTVAMAVYFLLLYPVTRGVDRFYRRVAHLGRS